MLETPEQAYDIAVEKNIIRPDIEDLILESPVLAALYAANVIRGRWIKGEEIIASRAESAFIYADGVIRGRWSVGEDAILTRPEFIARYARDVIKGRWGYGEHFILTDHVYVAKYGQYDDGSGIDVEDIMSYNAEFAYMYARDVIKGRWPEAEHIIASNPVYSEQYEEHLQQRKVYRTD